MYFAAGTTDSAERDRLSALEAAFDSRSVQHLRTLGVQKGWKCWDVGAGGGSITRWLAEQVGNEGTVVATDIDTRFLREISLPNVRVRKLNILEGSLDSESFDLAHCRFLLIHLPDPALAIQHMIGAIRIGGWIMIEEFDFFSLQAVRAREPASAFFTAKVQETFRQVGRQQLFDPYLGRRSKTLLEEAGLVDVQSKGTVMLRNGGESEALLHVRSLPTLSEAGACSQADSHEMQTILIDPDFRFVGATVFAAWGRRRR